MAFEEMGLGAILGFKADAALTQMARTKKAFAGLSTAASQLSQVASSVAKAFVPIGLALGVAGMQAANFEQAMADVSAKLESAERGTLPALAAEAKKLGSTTRYSASQVANAMELMAAAGFKPQEILEGVGGVLNAAAAEGMGVADAADIVAGTLRGMGLAAADTTRVADVFALASARTNASISGLGESFRYAQGQARAMGLPFEQVAAVLARISDANMKGSIAGTAFGQMLAHLAKPSKKAQVVIDQMGLSVEKIFATEQPIVTLMEQLDAQLKRYGSNVARTNVLTKMFGIEGARAYNALAASGPDALKKLHAELLVAQGAAKDMAGVRLDTLQGSFLLLKSAAEGFAIEFMTPLLKGTTELTRSFSAMIAQLVQGGGAMKPVTAGIREGIDLVIASVARARALFADLRTKFGGTFSPATIQMIAKFATVLMFAATAAAPLLAGVAAVGFLLSSVIIPAFVAVKTVILSVLTLLTGPLGLAIVGLGLFFFTFRNEVIEYLGGIWDALRPMLAPLKEMWATTLEALKLAFDSVMSLFSSETTNMVTDWREVGRTVGTVLATINTTEAKVVSVTVTHASWIVAVGVALYKLYPRISILGNIYSMIQRVVSVVKLVNEGLTDLFAGNILTGLQKLGKAMLDWVLMPLRQITLAMVKMADGLNFPVPAALRAFAEHGLDPILPQIEKPSNAPGATKAVADGTNKLTANVTIEDKRVVEVKNEVKVDGHALSIATAKHKTEISERSGFRATPWQRRQALEQGAVPVPTGG